MITIITRYEDTQMPRDVDRQMWRQLKGAFRVDKLIFVEDDKQLEDALMGTSDLGDHVFLEPLGSKTVKDIPTGDIVMVVGNTAMNNRAWAEADEEYSISCPSLPTHLYGINAAAIALAFRHGQ